MSPKQPKTGLTLKPEAGSYGVSGSPVELVHTTTAEALKANRWLIAAYVAISLVSISSSYFTSGFLSVGTSTAVTVATTWIGYLMIQKVITITRNIR
jgi:hypothetical protein